MIMSARNHLKWAANASCCTVSVLIIIRIFYIYSIVNEFVGVNDLKRLSRWFIHCLTRVCKSMDRSISTSILSLNSGRGWHSTSQGNSTKPFFVSRIEGVVPDTIDGSLLCATNSSKAEVGRSIECLTEACPPGVAWVETGLVGAATGGTFLLEGIQPVKMLIYGYNTHNTCF